MYNLLFLQGPLGPFFDELASHLSLQGHHTYKICLNGGDKHFSSRGGDFLQPASEWREYLRGYLIKRNIHAVIVYGDCRFYHRVARELCLQMGIAFFAFEEGYIRAGYVTLEEGGCNANSPFISSPFLVSAKVRRPANPGLQTKNTFWQRAWFAARYYWAMRGQSHRFTYYEHHRPWSWWQEGLCWLKGIGYKTLGVVRDSFRLKRFLARYSKKLFIFPLQVSVDFQIKAHSDFDSMQDALRYTLVSFATHAVSSDALLIKHHPQDKGHINYHAIIKKECLRLGIQGRVLYGHNFRLPGLYPHAKGVVTVNSTVGISALLHKLPTKVLGKSIYDRKGLTSSLSLDDFWRETPKVNSALFRRFQHNLIRYTQQVGDFYLDRDTLIENSAMRIVRTLDNSYKKAG